MTSPPKANPPELKARLLQVREFLLSEYRSDAAEAEGFPVERECRPAWDALHDALAELDTRPTPPPDNAELIARLLSRFGWMTENEAEDIAKIAAEALSQPRPDGDVEFRDALVKAYLAGAKDVHEAWTEGEDEKPWGFGPPDFTEAAHDYVATAAVDASDIGWQPIETAPEGQWALISEATGTWMTVAVKRGGDWFEFNGSTHMRNAADLSATHWRPLPEPPALKTGRSKP